ncbi:MAG: isochorismatase family protein [Acidimicrobiales bacterium]
MTAGATGPAFDHHTALLVIDVQNDFADPSGNLHVAGGEEVVPAVNRLVAEARSAGALVVYTQDWHPAHTPHFAPDGGQWPVHCVAGSWGAALCPGLAVEGPVVRKGTGAADGYSGFTVRDPPTGATTPTGLQDLLDERGVERLVVAGLALEVCVKETVLDARRLGYPTSVVLAATRPVEASPGDGAAAAAEMAAAGAVVV